MPESFFELSQKDQREALEYARAETGRPAHLLEKDIWVVWALRTLFEAQVGADLTMVSILHHERNLSRLRTHLILE